eukprot:scaffold5684_cov169-Amphora_coffeaeformis.AAC.8
MIRNCALFVLRPEVIRFLVDSNIILDLDENNRRTLRHFFAATSSPNHSSRRRISVRRQTHLIECCGALFIGVQIGLVECRWNRIVECAGSIRL